ncbi:MAG: ClpXP protease specificity-enhancing factor SspB [Sphingomonadaceae bacterium]|nr:ClpXP protease specificity-enhancing factor SspB [Sphingomonadaceae bacterium]
MNDPVPDSLIPYDEIVQDTLRLVVRRVLQLIEGSDRLPGTHHFYIAFSTKAPGVDIPQHLAERYPEEMTIVLQHRFWDLRVDDDFFTVGLTFNQVPAKLRVPFDAVTGFVDPAVNFALSFPAKGVTAPSEEPAAPPVAVPVEDGSNVVAFDFRRKK